jgi:UDP-glucose 4-epimerase
LTQRLAARGHVVVGAGHAPRVEAARAAVPAGVEMFACDVEALPALIASRGQFDVIAHLAGGGGPQRCAADPVAAVRANVRGTSGLVDAAARAGVGRVVFASTIAVYGTFREPVGPYREADDALPDDLYGAVKEAAEHAVVSRGGTSLRIANVYGAGSGVDMGVSGAVERFARAAATGGAMKIFGTGGQRIDYVHVDDVCDAFLLALEHAAPPSMLNVGGGAPIAVRELAELALAIGRELGAAPTLTFEPAPEGKTWPDRALAIGAARALGWAPKTSYEDGMRGLVRMMKGA